MNSAPQVPSLFSLFRRDLVIARASKTAAFMIIVIVGFRWTAPSGSPPPGVDLSFEVAMAKWVPIGALVIASLALVVLAQRYVWVRTVLGNGVAIQGVVENVNVHTREAAHSENAPAFQRTTIRSYYAVIRYQWSGEEKKARIRLPSSPFVHGIVKGDNVDLMLLASAPNRPLIRAVYFGRF